MIYLTDGLFDILICFEGTIRTQLLGARSAATDLRRPNKRAIPSSFRQQLPLALRDTMVHLLAVEWLWLERWRGRSPGVLLAPEEFPALGVVNERWNIVEREMKLYLGTLSAETLEQPTTCTIRYRGGVSATGVPEQLLRDRDCIYLNEVRLRIASLQMEEVLSAPRSPWQNPYAERLIGSIPRACLDHFVILNAKHLKRTLSSYFALFRLLPRIEDSFRTRQAMSTCTAGLECRKDRQDSAPRRPALPL
jgi:hypothetical protein